MILYVYNIGGLFSKGCHPGSINTMLCFDNISKHNKSHVPLLYTKIFLVYTGYAKFT